MKKRTGIILLILTILVFGACNNSINKSNDDKASQKNQQENKEENKTETKELETKTVENVDSAVSDKNEAKEAFENDSEQESQTKEKIKPQILSVNKTIVTRNEWYEDTPSLLAKSDYSYILLDGEECDNYPELASSLRQLSDMCKKNMDDEFDNLVSFAYEELEAYDGFNTQTSKLDMHVRRADSIAFSMLSDSYLDTTYISELRSFHGTNYDTQTGKELVITDVIKDMSRVPQIVKEELTGNMWGGELSSETAIEEFFEERKAEDISWTLDYSGITLYFNRGDIADPVYENQTCTISFKEYPELFVEKYTEVPDAYAVKLPISCSNYFDLNENENHKEFIVSAHFDEAMGYYSDIYLIKNDDFYEESICAYGFNPYYIKTADGRHLLYLFVESADSWHRLMNLYVYDIIGKIHKIDEVALAPHFDVEYDGSSVFTLPLNPEKMYLDYYMNDNGYYYPSFSEYHNVGSYGIPELLGDGIIMDYPMEEDVG